MSQSRRVSFGLLDLWRPHPLTVDRGVLFFGGRVRHCKSVKPTVRG